MSDAVMAATPLSVVILLSVAICTRFAVLLQSESNQISPNPVVELKTIAYVFVADPATVVVIWAVVWALALITSTLLSSLLLMLLMVFALWKSAATSCVPAELAAVEKPTPPDTAPPRNPILSVLSA